MVAHPTRREALAMGVLAISAASAAPAEPETGWLAAMDEAGKAAVAAGTTAGLAIAMVTGTRTLARGYGLANLETGTPAGAESVFRIASVTKTFTATAVLILRERGRLRLEQPLADFYPAIPGGSGITLRHLLSHTSGLRDYVRGGLPADVGRDWTTPDEFAAGVAHMEGLQDFPAGTRFSYSNTGYILLGGVIEKASGMPYERFLADAIFGPCGMIRTAVDHDQDVVPGRADGYSLAQGKPGVFRHHPAQKLPFSAGAVRSTVTDMARWTRAFMGGRVVPPSVVREMTAPARVASGARVGDARWWPPGFDPGKPPAFAQDDNYGLGWESTTFYGARTVGHNGGIAGYNSILTHYLDRDMTLILLANTENGIIAPAFGLMEKIGRARA